MARPRKAESEKLVFVGGKVHPTALAVIERIEETRGWNRSETLRKAFELLIRRERRRLSTEAQAA